MFYCSIQTLDSALKDEIEGHLPMEELGKQGKGGKSLSLPPRGPGDSWKVSSTEIVAGAAAPSAVERP